MTAAAVLALTISPAPYDLALADGLLHEPPETPAEVEPCPRFRVALLAVMHRLGALDGDADHNWFGPGLSFASELDHARRLVAEVRTCPPAWAGRLVPPPAECRRVAEFNRAVAARLREEAGQASDHRAAELDSAAAECDWAAVQWSPFADAGWGRPLRVRLRDGLNFLGPDGDPPPRYVPRLFSGR